MMHSDLLETTAYGNRIGRGLRLFDDEPGTIAELFRHAAEKHKRTNALNYKRDGQWKSVSSAEMIDLAECIALGLYSLGLRKGDRAAILASNSPHWTLTDAGCQFAGVLDVPIYTTLSPASVNYILRDSGSRVLFLGNGSSLEGLRDALDGLEFLQKVVLFDHDSIEHEGTMSLDELIAAGRRLRGANPKLAGELSGAVRPDDLATIIYTSGTTGEPKGVMLTHTNIISNVIDAGEKYSFTESDSCLSVLPLSHIFERSAMYLYIFNGMAVHYAESVERTPENLAEVRPTIFVGVPRIFEKVYAKAKLKAAQTGGLSERIFDLAIEVAKAVALRRESRKTVPMLLRIQNAIADILVFRKIRRFFGGRLRFCITGGAALSDEIFLIFTGAGIPIMQGYGLTETSPVISSNNPFEMRLGTVGKPIRNVRVRLAADGEIEVTGPGVMLGYYRKEASTREAFTTDGWFRTGDIGEIDADGFLRITDRKKELFKTSGGKYIAPSPIEQMIRSSRFVNQAVLIGSERKFAAALIVPNFEMLRSYAKHKGLDLHTPAEFCAHPAITDLIERQVEKYTQGLARFETVKRIALLEDEFSVEAGELTPTLKVKRNVIDERYRDLIDRIYDEAESKEH